MLLKEVLFNLSATIEKFRTNESFTVGLEKYSGPG